MQSRFFTVPVRDPDRSCGGAKSLHRRPSDPGHRPAVHRQRGEQRLGICVSFDSGEAAAAPRGALANCRGKVDFKDILSDPEFAVFSRLRALRKEKADAEGIPAYAVFTNEQLAEMVQKRVANAAALREIAGVGEARAEKYGAGFLAIPPTAGHNRSAPAVSSRRMEPMPAAPSGRCLAFNPLVRAHAD